MYIYTYRVSLLALYTCRYIYVFLNARYTSRYRRHRDIYQNIAYKNILIQQVNYVYINVYEYNRIISSLRIVTFFCSITDMYLLRRSWASPVEGNLNLRILSQGEIICYLHAEHKQARLCDGSSNLCLPISMKTIG